MSSEFSSFALITARGFLVENLAILLVPLFVIIAWRLWTYFRHTIFLDSQKFTMLEIRLPRDVFKSPAAMEIVLVNSLWQTGGVGTWYQRYWQGNLRQWFSLEIVSLGGRIHFFVRTPTKFRGIIESQVYAQYPQAEISEVDDYTDLVPPYDKKNGEWNLWGSYFVLTKPDPYPIKTYVDYGLDKTVGMLKEEERIDPITPVMEFMGSLGPDEQAWFQIAVRADTKRYKDKDGKNVDWKKAAEEEIKKLKDKFKKEEGKEAPMKTKADDDMINALERSIQKAGFDCGIIGMYLAKKDSFNPNNIAGFISSLRQYNSPALNGFRPDSDTSVLYPWQDLSGNVVARKKADLLEMYRSRGYFYPHFDPLSVKHYLASTFSTAKTPIILNSEELATLYHFPGRVAETPAFKRVDSKKSEPPENLPI